jgi:hypothetical protein
VNHGVVLAFTLAVSAHSLGASGASREQAVIYGSDDRREVYDFDAGDWGRHIAGSSLVAIGLRSSLVAHGDDVVLNVPTARERLNLCPEERFSEQPAFAECTGVALGSDLVLTAAHCLRLGPLSDLVALSGYYYEQEGQLAPLHETDVHDIAGVIYEETDWGYVWLRLEPKGGALQPVAFEDDPIEMGMPVVSINHGAMLPAKIDKGGSAFPIDNRAFFTTVDAFGGASGGPIFSPGGELLGVLISGGVDYRMTSRGCLVAVQLSDAQIVAKEFAVRPRIAVDGLCTHQPDNTLCTVNPSARSTGFTCAIQRLEARSRPSQLTIGGAACLLLFRRQGRRRSLRSHLSTNGARSLTIRGTSSKSTRPGRRGRREAGSRGCAEAWARRREGSRAFLARGAIPAEE